MLSIITNETAEQVLQAGVWVLDIHGKYISKRKAGRDEIEELQQAVYGLLRGGPCHGDGEAEWGLEAPDLFP